MPHPADPDRRRLVLHRATCILELIHYLLMLIITSPRRFPNLLHWLPIILSLQVALLDRKDDADEEKDEREDTASRDKVRSIINAISDTALYWSLVKVPAQSMIIASMLPYAVALSASHDGNVSSRLARWTSLVVPPFTILVIGIALIHTQKMDVYSFAQLAVAVFGKTVTMRPDWTRVAESLLGTTSEWISHQTTTLLYAFQAGVPYFSPSTRGKPTVRRRSDTSKTSFHLRTTVFIFLVEAVVQFPKRWSFPTRSCWIWGLGVLLVRGLGYLFEKERRKEEDRQQGYSKLGHVEEVLDDGGESVILGLRSCVSSAAAMFAFAIASFLVTGNVNIGVNSNTLNLQCISFITVAWTITWTVTRRTGPFGKPFHANIAGSSAVESQVPRGISKGQRWISRVLLSLAAVPTILAMFKHGVTGNKLLVLSGELDKAMFAHDHSNLAHSASSAVAARNLWPSPLVRLPTVDIVMAYNNEPVKDVRKTISQLRSELTWAHVNVTIYHQGIPGYGESLDDKEHNKSKAPTQNTVVVEGAVETLRKSTGADLIVPRKNIGRSIGAYFEHINDQWDSLSEQTIFMQAERHATELFWQRMRLVDPSVGYMSLGHYKPFQYPYEEGNNWPFNEVSLVWNKFRPEVPMPEDAPMTVTYNGQMVVSLATIRRTDRKVWKEMYDILVSDVHDPRHVPGFAWPAKKEGPASPYFSHILERAWPLMADCYSVSLTTDCTARFFADNANGGCLCRDEGRN